jgi:hypothetical protein
MGDAALSDASQREPSRRAARPLQRAVRGLLAGFAVLLRYDGCRIEATLEARGASTIAECDAPVSPGGALTTPINYAR